MGLLSVDLKYRGRDYRIEEKAREIGAQIRPTEQITGCFSCPRIMPIGTMHFTLMARCIPCAISGGRLIETDASVKRRADAQAERAVGAGGRG